MKMKGKSKLILLFAGLASLFLLGGCSFSDSLEDIVNKNNLKAQVTYYSNGGKFEGNSETKDMYFKSGSKALDIGKINPTSGTVSIERSGYDLEGWYYAVDEDQDGIPDSENGVYKLGDAVNFSQKLEDGDHWLVVAKWELQIRVRVKLVCEEGQQVPKKLKQGEKDPTYYKRGDEVAAYRFERGSNTLDLDNRAPFEVEGKAFTFLEYYTDEACQNLQVGKVEKQTTDTILYARYIEGDWSIVKTAEDVENMFLYTSAGKRYWLFNDIDMAKRAEGEENVSIGYRPRFGCEIQGNGYTISNLLAGASLEYANDQYALFGEIQSSAVIKDLTLKNVRISYSTRVDMIEVYFVFSSIATGAQIEGVNIDGTMNIQYPPNLGISILNYGDGSNFNKCLYGGYTTDAEYTAANPNGFSVNVGKTPDEYITIN